MKNEIVYVVIINNEIKGIFFDQSAAINHCDIFDVDDNKNIEPWLVQDLEYINIKEKKLNYDFSEEDLQKGVELFFKNDFLEGRGTIIKKGNKSEICYYLINIEKNNSIFFGDKLYNVNSDAFKCTLYIEDIKGIYK